MANRYIGPIHGLDNFRVRIIEYGYVCATSNTGNTTLRVVLDTSVLVAASRSRNGASFQLVSMLPTSRFEIALTVALYTEWQAVMTRAEHLPKGLTADDALGFLQYLASIAHLQDVHFLWRPFLRDPDDDMVVECAVASGSQFIVTHNVKDFQRADSLQLKVVTPSAFLQILRSTL